MTKREIMKLKPNTLIRVKSSVKCHPMWKNLGQLTFANVEPTPDNEYKFGIVVGNSVCYRFKAANYELYNAT